MSDTDSFIDEVSEEVRRDRLYKLARKYGWIAGLCIILIIGGFGALEWQKAQKTARAQQLGDDLLQALESESGLGRSTALVEQAGDGVSGAVARFFAAADIQDADPEGAGALLQEIGTLADVPPIYKDLAVLKLALIPDYPMLSDARIETLEGLTAPGAPFRLAALEQIAALRIERNERDEALEILRTLTTDAEASPGLRQRAQQLIVALGGVTEPGQG